MTKLLSTLGFLGGIALMATLYLNVPSAGPVEAREDNAGACRMVEVALDEGYGITRTEMRRVCGRAH